VAFLVGAILLGTVIREWRARIKSREAPHAVTSMETRDQ